MDAEQLSQEINLKAMTALANIVDDEERGIITRAEAKTALRAIFDMAGGLVPTSTFDLISAAADQYKHAKGVEVEWVRIGDAIKGVARVCGAGAVLRIDQALPHRKPSYDIDTDAKAKEHAARLFGQLRGQVQW